MFALIDDVTIFVISSAIDFKSNDCGVWRAAFSSGGGGKGELPICASRGVATLSASGCFAGSRMADNGLILLRHRSTVKQEVRSSS